MDECLLYTLDDSDVILSYHIYASLTFIALTLLVGRQEEHPACKNGGMVEVGTG